MSDRLNAAELQRRLRPRPGGQGVAGSNPAVPTGRLRFSNIFMPHRSQQESQSPAEWSLKGVCRDVLPRHLSTPDPAKSASQGVRDR
jgi:hypothetical protein